MFQAPEAALEAANQESSEGVVSTWGNNVHQVSTIQFEMIIQISKFCELENVGV